MTNIHDLTNLLRNVRNRYQAEWIDADETKKRELAELDRDYKPDTPTYAAKKREIEFNFDVAIVKAREKAAKKAAEEIEDLKEWELVRVGTINETALSKINMLRGIPLTTTELKQVLNKHGSSNYWVQRAVSALAQENGIPVTELPIDSSLDTKLSVLSQLSGQLDNLLKDYSNTARTDEAAKARFLYLNDDVLKNAENIYNNGVQDLAETDAAMMSFYKIRAMYGQMSKACAITNALRNLKKEDSKNMLLYHLAMDNTIMSEAYEVAGISDVMSEWKHGKAERYAKAVNMMDKLKTMQDTEKIKESLRNYMHRVEMGSETENEFLRHEITKTHKKNTFIGKALQEMDSEEVKELLRDNETQSEEPGSSAKNNIDGASARLNIMEKSEIVKPQEGMKMIF